MKIEKLEKRTVRKILVKCPLLANEMIAIFPFLILLSEDFPRADLVLLCEENCSYIFKFLPFKVSTHERPKDKKSFLGTHHYCANLNDVFNIDLFFDLENSLNSSFMGFNFRARERVGFSRGLNRFFLTSFYEPLQNIGTESIGIKLLENYSGKKYQDLKILREITDDSQNEKIEQLFKTPKVPDFILVMLDDFLNVSKEIKKWTSFFDSFTNQSFIIWSQYDEEAVSDLFSSVDLGENRLYMHRGLNPKDLISIFTKVKGVVVNNVWAEGLCNYLDVNSVSLFTTPTPPLENYHYFHSKPKRFFVPEVGPIVYAYQEQEEMESIREAVDKIHFLFKL